MGLIERNALLHLHVCTEKISKHAAGLETLTQFRADGDLGQLAVFYRELDVQCQVEFSRIIEIDAEVSNRKEFQLNKVCKNTSKSTF